MTDIHKTDKPTTKSIWPKLITIGLILLTIVIAISLLPRGFSEDTSVIGTGTNSLVLIHDNNLLQSGEAIQAMNQIRDKYYAENLEFIIADVKTPTGKSFADKYSLQPPMLVFFSPEGEILLVLDTPQTGESLSKKLETIFTF